MILCYKSWMGLWRNLDIRWLELSFGPNALTVFNQKSFSIKLLSLNTTLLFCTCQGMNLI